MTDIPASLCSLRWFAIGPDHPALPGHFPGSPVVPGVVLLDHVIDFVEQQAGGTAFVSTVPWVKFLRPLLPGQMALLAIEPASTTEFRFSCRVGTERIAEGRMALARTGSHD